MGSTDAARSKVLDGLRGVAVLQVVLYHYFLLNPGRYNGLELGARLGSAIDGVTLFFVLSGFFIGGNLLDVREAPALFRTYYGRRACRILPLYAVLLLSYGLVRFVDERSKLGFIYYWYSDVPFWSYLVFWQNNLFSALASLGASWLIVTWSLAVEQQFYAVIPWVIRLVPDRRLLAALCFGGMGTAIVNRLAHPGIAVQLIDRIDALAAGLLLAILVRSPSSRILMPARRRGLRLLLAVYVITLLALRTANRPVVLVDNPHTAAVMYALLIFLLVDDAPWWPVRLILRWLAPVGLWSYFIYLFHLPISYVFLVLWPAASMAALPVTIALAAVSYRYVEEPLIRRGHRLKYWPEATRGDPVKA